jgi:hypothetical protein
MGKKARQKIWLVKPEKTASKTTREILSRFVGNKNGIWVADGHPLNRRVHHDSITQVRQLLRDADIRPKSVYTFSFVRNPWDRMVSYWIWVNRHPGPKRWSVSFADWLEVFVQRKAKAQNPLTCWDYVSIDNKVAVDFVGRFERFDADLARLGERLSLPLAAGPMPRLYKADKREHYSHYYTAELRDRVADLFADDLEHLAYRFEAR